MRRLLVAALSLALLLCLCACRTTTGTDHDQIVRTAIDLAQAYSDRGEYDKALEVYDRALEQADDYRLYYNKAIILTNSGRNVEAAALCATSFEKYNYIMAFKRAQALNLTISGDDAGAIAVYEQMLSLNPYDVETRARLIQALMALGENEEAYTHALLLWNQGYHDKTTVEFLYQLKPSLWANVYKEIVGQ